MKTYIVSFLLLLSFVGCSQHPKKDDWYEDIESRKRVQVSDVGPGAQMVKTLEDLKAKVPTVPMIISVHGDSAKTVAGTCVRIMKLEVYQGVPITIYDIYSLSRFEKDFMLIKKD